MIDQHHGWNFSSKPLFLGLVLSLILTFAAYRIVTEQHLFGHSLILTLYGLAMGQAIVQLIFYLHIGLETKPHWNIITFLFTLLVTIIVIGGSLWIMSTLNYQLMPTM